MDTCIYPAASLEGLFMLSWLLQIEKVLQSSNTCPPTLFFSQVVLAAVDSLNLQMSFRIILLISTKIAAEVLIGIKLNI